MKKNIIIFLGLTFFWGCQERPNSPGFEKNEPTDIACEDIEGIFLHPEAHLTHLTDFKNKFQLKLKIEAGPLKKDFAGVIEEKNGSQGHRFLRIFPALAKPSGKALKNNPSYKEIVKNCPIVFLEPYLGSQNTSFELNAKLDSIGFLKVKNPFDDRLKEGSDYYPFLITRSINKTKEKVSLTNNWDKPFLIAMERLAKKDWERHATASLTVFQNKSHEMRKELQGKGIAWQKLLDPQASENQIKNAREILAKKEYINRVFYTKPGTLVFRVSSQPFIIAKMDKRNPDTFDAFERGYYDAFKKTEAVKKLIPKNEFDHLFLPWELVGSVKGVKTKIIFSEAIPLFSEAEIDNRVLLHLLMSRAEKDETLRQELMTLFEQVIRYICLIDFDDVNFRNIVFTVDGRLSPFDTDSGLAKSGVHSFLTIFSAYKILNKEQVLAVIQSDCAAGPFKNNPRNIVDLYKNTSAEDVKFNSDKTAINKMIDFLSTKEKGDTKVSSMKDLDEKYGKVVESVFNKNIKNHDGKEKLFGQRCQYVGMMIEEVQNEILKASAGALSKDQAFEKARLIMEEARKQGKIFASGPIDTLGKSISYGITDFICF